MDWLFYSYETGILVFLCKRGYIKLTVLIYSNTWNNCWDIFKIEVQDKIEKKKLTATRRVGPYDPTLPWYPRAIHTVNNEKQEKNTLYKLTKEVYTDMCTDVVVHMFV